MKKWYDYLVGITQKKEQKLSLQIAGRTNLISPANEYGKDLTHQIEKFLLENYRFRYNCLTEQTEYMELSGTCFLPIGNRELNSLCLDARSRGINCWDRDISRFVHSRKIISFHPFRHYMDNLPEWDGVDRVKKLARRVKDEPVWINGFHRWMRAMAAQWMEIPSQHANSVAPVLVSLQQGMNKSTFCKMLMPDELRDYYTDSFDLNAGSGTEQKLTVFGLINLDEMDRYTDKKMAVLKNLMQMAGINIRKAHKKSYSALPRIASFIATSNEKELLCDPSGSRRFLCVEIRQKIDCSPVDYGQLYAQLKEEVLANERSWFTTEEEREIMKRNFPFQKQPLVCDLFLQYYRKPHENEEGELIAAMCIFEKLKKNNPSIMSKVSAMHFGRDLIKMGINRIHTREGNRYEVVRVKE